MAAQNKINELHRIKYDLFKSQDPENGRFDVIFEIEGKLIYAHINLVSSTFDRMFSDQWMKNKDQPIMIETYSYDDFHQLLTFLYSGQCQLTDENIFAMVDISEFYGVDLFKVYCDEYLSSMKITTENIYQLMEIAETYRLPQLSDSVLAFIIGNFQSLSECDGFLKADKSVVEEHVFAFKDKIKPEDLFEAIFNWTEKRAIDKQAVDPNLNLNDAIKVEISDFLRYISFRRMGLKFLVEFVVPRGFIFSSLNEMSNILSDRISKPLVKITNDLGQTLHGNLISDKTVINSIKALSNQSSAGSYWWNTNCNIPSTPSPLNKNDDVEWYLIYFPDGDIGVKHCCVIGSDDYLLAELTPGPSDFDTAENCKIEVE